MGTVAELRCSPSEREAIERDGYVLRQSVFDRDEVAEITDACERLLADLVKDRKGRRFHVGSYTFEPDQLTDCTVKWEGDSDVVHGIEPFAHLSPDLEKWAYDARFLGPSADFVGDDDPRLFTEKLNLKRPKVGGANPWHQDWPYWEFADDRSQFRMRRIESSGAKSPAITINSAGRVSGYPRVARSGNELVFAWTEGAESEGMQKVKGAIARLSRATAP